MTKEHSEKVFQFGDSYDNSVLLKSKGKYIIPAKLNENSVSQKDITIKVEVVDIEIPLILSVESKINRQM